MDINCALREKSLILALFPIYVGETTDRYWRQTTVLFGTIFYSIHTERGELIHSSAFLVHS
jgi:hypothetical protein